MNTKVFFFFFWGVCVKMKLRVFKEHSTSLGMDIYKLFRYGIIQDRGIAGQKKQAQPCVINC